MNRYCEKYFDSIDDLVEGELGEQIAEQTGSHVFACPKCRERYETLRREKEIYAHYLFETEPPIDLWTNFQARLDAEREKTGLAVVPPAIVSTRKTNVFGFPRFTPLFAASSTAALLVVFGIGSGWLEFAPSEIDGNDKFVARTQPDNSAANKFKETEKSGTTVSTEIIKSDESDFSEKNRIINVKNDKSKTLKVKSVSVATEKPIIAEALKTGQKTVSAKAEKNLADASKLNADERAKRLRLQNLELAIADQVEKVELLLRSFRNARATEEDETFDVGYEKAQARKLLEKNAQLKLDAENNGIGYAEELLSRVEPYLLDIANLEGKPAPGKVLDIKERVSSQNIIASLQVY